jgi:hypothetical protein
MVLAAVWVMLAWRGPGRDPARDPRMPPQGETQLDRLLDRERPPTPLHTLTLAEVMSPPDAPERMSTSWAWYVRNGWGALDALVERHGLRDRAVPCGVPGYAIACDVPDRVVAVIDEATGMAAGGLVEGNLHILRDHQGRGLAPLVMEMAFDVGIKRIGHSVALSPGGRKTRKAAHLISVRRALERGVEVRAEVLADYPGLVPQGRPAGPPPVRPGPADVVDAEFVEIDGDVPPPGPGR